MAVGLLVFEKNKVIILNKRIFVYTAKKRLCFREAAKIMLAHKALKSKIELVANGQMASTDSILSLVKLGIVEGTSVIITTYSDDGMAADDAIRSVIAIV